MKKTVLVLAVIVIAGFSTTTLCKSLKNQKAKPLHQLQQEFLDLRFGMFICCNISTSTGYDWSDPNQSPDIFNPKKMDCNQWADAAVSAGMTYGCLVTKHHDGFCVWPTKTTDHCVRSSPFKRDMVKEYVEAFRKKGLKTFLYYSMLDQHHNIRPGWIDRNSTKFIKDQLTELLTNYGEIACLVIDGWDARWSRLSYEEISFEEIYKHVKSLQPNCIITEHNAGKYPSEQLFYTDVKHYEQNAGQKISRETNDVPAQAGIPINKNWFWKDFFPTSPVKPAEFIVNENLIPLNNAHCNFILNVAPNPDGLIDDNAIEELKKIGKLWKHPGKAPKLPVYKTPIIASNLAKGQKMNSSWSHNVKISDYANDDDFQSRWMPSSLIKGETYLEVVFDKPTELNTVAFVEYFDGWNPGSLFKTKLKSYAIQLWDGKKWVNIPVIQNKEHVRLHKFKTYKAQKVRVLIDGFEQGFGISECLVYNQE